MVLIWSGLAAHLRHDLHFIKHSCLIICRRFISLQIQTCLSLHWRLHRRWLLWIQGLLTSPTRHLFILLLSSCLVPSRRSLHHICTSAPRRYRTLNETTSSIWFGRLVFSNTRWLTLRVEPGELLEFGRVWAGEGSIISIDVLLVFVSQGTLLNRWDRCYFLLIITLNLRVFHWRSLVMVPFTHILWSNLIKQLLRMHFYLLSSLILYI